jgi:hypothetical protein
MIKLLPGIPSTASHPYPIRADVGEVLMESENEYIRRLPFFGYVEY